MRKVFLFSLLAILFFQCQDRKNSLPILGEKQINGKDTLYHTISNFEFLDQDSSLVSDDITNGAVYVADFFFTSCPTICPVMSTQLLKVNDAYKNTEDFKIISYTIDPSHDSPSVLKSYKEKLGVKNEKWYFLTGDQDSIYHLAQKSYLVSAQEDKEAIDEGGFKHSGALVLVDRQKRIRGFYDGTKPEEVDQLIKDIPGLLDEK